MLVQSEEARELGAVASHFDGDGEEEDAHAVAAARVKDDRNEANGGTDDGNEQAAPAGHSEHENKHDEKGEPGEVAVVDALNEPDDEAGDEAEHEEGKSRGDSHGTEDHEELARGAWDVESADHVAEAAAGEIGSGDEEENEGADVVDKFGSALGDDEGAFIVLGGGVAGEEAADATGDDGEERGEEAAEEPSGDAAEGDEGGSVNGAWAKLLWNFRT